MWLSKNKYYICVKNNIQKYIMIIIFVYIIDLNKEEIIIYRPLECIFIFFLTVLLFLN